jgi:hypothetical protein
LFPLFRSLTRRNPSLTVVFDTLGGCPPVPGVNVTRPGANCLRFAAAALRDAESGRYESVVIASAWAPYFRPDASAWEPDFQLCFADRWGCRPAANAQARFRESFSALAQAATRIRAAGAAVALMGPTPFPAPHNRDYNSAFARRTFFGLSADDLKIIDLGEFRARTAFVDGELRRVAAESGASWLDPALSLCGPTACPTVDARGAPVFRDGAHLRASFVTSWIFPPLIEFLRITEE